MREDRTHVSVFGDDGIYFASDLPHIREAINLLAEYEDTGLTPEDFAAAGQMEHFKEWREWHKADAEKRLVVLPCKVGDTVYRVWKVDGRKTEITEHKMENIVQIAQWLHFFGKTVFVLRKEAEAFVAKEAMQK